MIYINKETNHKLVNPSLIKGDQEKLISMGYVVYETNEDQDNEIENSDLFVDMISTDKELVLTDSPFELTHTEVGEDCFKAKKTS